MRSRLLISALVVLALLSAGLAAFLVARLDGAAPLPTRTTGEALIGGPFGLVDQRGRRVTEADFRGRWMLVYFGYTHCPDICPLGLQTMMQALDLVPPPVAERIVPVFVTVDPERDTVEAVRNYVSLFDPRLIGLTGTPEAIEAMKRAWRVYARKAEPASGPGGGPGYLVDHSTFTYLMGPDGRYVTHFGHGTTPEAMAQRLVGLVGAST